jgi:SecD-like export protein
LIGCAKCIGQDADMTTWRSALVVSFVLACAQIPVSADEGSLSFIHRTERIDVPTSAIQRIKAYATQTFMFETGPVEYPFAGVEVCFARKIQRRMCELTRRIVDEPMDVVIGCEVVARPVVRERLCGFCISISAADGAEAERLAEKLRSEKIKTCPATS